MFKFHSGVGENKSRIQFDITAEALAELEALRREAGAANRAELIRTALRVYATLLGYSGAGYSVHVSKDEDTKEIVFT